VELDQRSGLGQWPRRLITSISINISVEDIAIIYSLEKLVKTGWNNSLKKVELVLTVPEVQRFMAVRLGNYMAESSYFTILNALAAVAKKNLFERAIVISPGPPSMQQYGSLTQAVAKQTVWELHAIWGGKLYYATYLVYGTELAKGHWWTDI
jgi:hypothetical protein